MGFQVLLKAGWRNASSGFVPAGIYDSDDPRFGQYVNYWLETDQAERLPDPEPEPVIAPEVTLDTSDDPLVPAVEPTVDLPVVPDESGQPQQLDLSLPEVPEVSDDPGDRDKPVARTKKK